MSRHARSHHHTTHTPPSTPVLKNPDERRTDTARPTAPNPPTKIIDAKSQASPMTLAAPQGRVASADTFQLIQMRAYMLWEQAGRPDGDAARENFWLQAEREIAAPQRAV